MDDWDVVVIGAGAAGLMAAARAAQRGRRTLLLEKKRRPGAKILMSGGSRCNLTHAIDVRGLVAAFGSQGPFLHSALAALGPYELVHLVEAEGVATKVEPGGKIFPVSDRAADVLAALMARLRRSGCSLAADEPVASIAPQSGGLRIATSKRTLLAEAAIVACGGQSYPSSGSTGDGYRWAAELGHTIVSPRPALTPIASNAPWLPPLQGLTLPDVEVSLYERDRDASPVEADMPATRRNRARHGTEGQCLARRRGPLLLAHFGVSGPAALDVSRWVSRHADPRRLVLRCDLVPDLKAEALDAELRAACGESGRRTAANIVARWAPQRLAETLVAAAGIDGQIRGAEITRQQRQQLVAAFKEFEIPVGGALGFNRAEVTAGGVALEEVDSHTMESRLVPGLYFAGEVLDIDGPIGGYNFQAAFSTGWLAGENA